MSDSDTDSDLGLYLNVLRGRTLTLKRHWLHRPAGNWVAWWHSCAWERLTSSVLRSGGIDISAQPQAAGEQSTSHVPLPDRLVCRVPHLSHAKVALQIKTSSLSDAWNRSVCVCLSARLSACLSVCLVIWLRICLCPVRFCLSVCMSAARADSYADLLARRTSHL